MRDQLATGLTQFDDLVVEERSALVHVYSVELWQTLINNLIVPLWIRSISRCKLRASINQLLVLN